MTPADQAQVQMMIQQAMAKNSQSQRFNLSNANRHQHTRTDGAPISANDITPGNSVVGNAIQFSTLTTYNIGVNFNPTSVLVHGTVVGPSGQEFIVIGNAQFGPSLYLQPGTSTSVIPGGQPETIVQCATYFGNSGGTSYHSAVTDGPNIVDVYYGGTIYVRAQITGYSNKGVQLKFLYLVSGWTAYLNFTIS